ncbi:hypothetical protein BRADI_4g13215v3 [Brachypodium distachyon]|uniref:Uncharacterized protein n=1 Tax=Brachypodium distachyon TaxID=15368 RepID=A0A0Q3HH07_BRADI|nr:hypothetical protein BRADI_4g13215v3 [Brachypodium distachyon]
MACDSGVPIRLLVDSKWTGFGTASRPGNGAVSFGFSGVETHLVPVGLGSIGLRLKAVWIGMVLVKLRFGTVWFGLQQPSKATGPLSLPPPMPPAAVASIVALPLPSRRPLAHPAQRSPFAPARSWLASKGTVDLDRCRWG